MQSLYQAYQSYERRVQRGEMEMFKAEKKHEKKRFRLPLTYRFGEVLIRLGLKLKQQALAGHTLTSATMAGK